MFPGGPSSAMASELSRFIEDELRSKGYKYEDDDPEADNPTASLMGALRVEVGPLRPPRATAVALELHIDGIQCTHCCRLV